MSESFLKEVLPIAIWVVIMIVSGRIKKNRKKGPAPTSRREQRTASAPRPVPVRPAPPVVRVLPARLPASARAEVAPVPTPPLRRIVPTGLAEVVDQFFARTAWDAALGAQMRSRCTTLRDPFQLLEWVDEVAEAALRQTDDLQQRLAEVVDRTVGSGEFNARTIDEFIQRSPQLAETWSREILADALGLALLGPGFADLRMQVEGQRRSRDVVPLQVSRDAGAVRMPYSVRRCVLDAGIRTFDMESGWAGSEGWPSGDAEIVFDLGGLQQIQVPTGPVAEASVAILQELIRTRIASLDGHDLVEMSAHHPWRGRMNRHLQFARTLSDGKVILEADEADLLPVFIHLHARDPGGSWEARLLALTEFQERKRSGRRRGHGHHGRQQRPLGRPCRGALLEGLLLTEILGEDLGRPASVRRAGGRG
ncbi:MAG: hypothetical protein ABIK09_20510 [Pseudomonadota bacterium]